MLRLPNEILLNISNCLFYIDGEFHTLSDKGALLALRLACRRFTDFCQSLVFKHVSLSYSEGGFTRLVEMAPSKHICRSVQGITYDFEDFGLHITASEYAELLGVWKPDLTVDDIEECKTDYARCQDRNPLEENNIDVSRLAAALRNFRRLRSIRLIRDCDSPGRLLKWMLGSHIYSRIALELPTLILCLFGQMAEW
jgi:hypothetical protein